MAMKRLLIRWLHAPDPTEWQDRKHSRKDRVRKHLGWRRTPHTDNVLDPDSKQGRVAAEHFNALRLEQVTEQVGEIEDEARVNQWSHRHPDQADRPRPEPVTVALREADDYFDATIPLDEEELAATQAWLDGQ